MRVKRQEVIFEEKLGLIYFLPTHLQSHKRNKPLTRGSNQKALAGDFGVLGKWVLMEGGCTWQFECIYYMATIVRTR